MKQHTILVDGNSLLRSYTYDPSKGKWSHANNFFTTLAEIANPLKNCKIIVLWDGKSWRKDYKSNYKANRDIPTETHPDKKVEERRLKKIAEKAVIYENAKLVKNILKLTNIVQISADNWEADDLAGYIVKDTARENLLCYKDDGEAPDYTNFRPITLLTGDQDWLQLVSNGVKWKDVRSPYKEININNFSAHTGYTNPKVFLEGKYLLGDTGDNVKGLEGFGEKKTQKFFELYGDIKSFQNTDYSKVVEMWGKLKPKSFDDLHSKKDAVYMEQEILMNLYSDKIPAPINLKKIKGEPDLDKLKSVFKEHGFLDLWMGFDEYIKKMGL